MNIKNGFSLIIIFLITSVSLMISEQLRFQSYYSTLKKINNQITNSKLNFEYDEKKGFFCRVEEKIEDSEIAFILPKEEILCSSNFD